MTDKADDPGADLLVSRWRLPLWRELTWGTEWVRLRASPVYWGVGLARGRGEPVLSVPGFLGSDLYLLELRHWLGRIGYRAYPSGIGRNADCPDVLLEKLLETVVVTTTDKVGRVNLIGHSLGGSLARAAAVIRPDLAARVITLGSPVSGFTAHPLVVALARSVSKLVEDPRKRPRSHGSHVHDKSCSTQVRQALESPLPGSVSITSIYSRSDGIVDWKASVVDAPGRNVEVKASHVGLVVNPQVYRHVAEALAAQ